MLATVDPAAFKVIIVELDGVDEAAGMRKEVEKLVLQTLVRMGQRVVVSSRPEGVDLRRYDEAHFVIMNLRPLDDEQQRKYDAEQRDIAEIKDFIAR